MGLSIKALLIDLDGTVHFKGELIAGAAEAIERLRENGLRLLFLTNIDSASPQEIAERLERVGLEIDPAEIMNPLQAGRAYVQNRTGRVFCLMPKHLAREFDFPGRGADPVRFVVVGDPRENGSYAELNAAFRHIMNGAEIVALQKGRFFYTADGVNLDTGAVVAMLEYAASRQAVVIGKPSAAFFSAALERVGVQANEVAVVGDDIYSDIAGAAGMKMPSVLVRTGKSSQQPPLPEGPQPTWTIDSIAGLPGLLGLGRTTKTS